MLESKDIAKEILLAESRIRPYVRETILEYSHSFSQLGCASVYCKLENLQHTGSFKVRGAMNKLLSLSEEELARGVVTASTGNHGAAVAFSLNRLGASGVVFVPTNTQKNKIELIERFGAEVRYFADDNADTEQFAREFAEQRGMTYISPYNDSQVVGGQGTIGIELIRQLDSIDAVFVSLGGGGLISGIAGYLKFILPQVHIIGCSPANSQVMIQSLNAGEILDTPSLPTLSDATAGGLEPGAITFELCQRFVDEYATVSEDEIQESLRQFIQTHQMLIEGSAAVAIASYLKMRERFAEKNVVIIICGANISLETLRRII